MLRDNKMGMTFSTVIKSYVNTCFCKKIIKFITREFFFLLSALLKQKKLSQIKKKNDKTYPEKLPLIYF